MVSSDFSSIRKEYIKQQLDENLLENDPFVQFRKWFDEALLAGLNEPNAMALATTGHDGLPSIRMVLLKEFDPLGFVFYTNYHSRKGRQLDQNPNAALLFYWQELERQVRIEGTVQKLSPDASDEYFHGRPFGSRVGAVVSKQSQVIGSRQELELAYHTVLSDKDKIIQRPPHWGGYVLDPYLFEFWQGREHRLHDRIQYRIIDNVWAKQRLAP